MREHPLTILVAEDDDAAAQLIKTNIKRTGIEATYIRAENGEEALKILLGKNEDVKIDPESNLVFLLDIRMPKVDGMQVLEYLKRNDNLKKIPVIMMTTSDQESEVDKCYELGCNFYVKKQIDYNKFVASIKKIIDFISVVQLPIWKEISNG